MSPKDFVNYLNGAIELGGLTELNQHNYQLVMWKFETVNPDNSKEDKFCSWFDGVVDMLDQPRMNSVQFAKLVNKLRETVNDMDNDMSDVKKHINTHGQVLC